MIPRLLSLLALALAASGKAQAPPAKNFDVITIKPYVFEQGRGHLGFRGFPNGRIEVGATTVYTLIDYAYDIQEFQIKGGPEWANSNENRFDVAATSSEPQPKNAPPRRANPNQAEREMLRSLLRDRFHLRFHLETRNSPVYVLVTSGQPLQLHEPADKTRDTRGGVGSTQADISTAIAFGQNISMAQLAKRIASDLNRPVIDQTGLTGSYDFNVPQFEPSNHDMASAIFDAMIKLGLKLQPGKAPVEKFIIDSVDHPDPN